MKSLFTHEFLITRKRLLLSLGVAAAVSAVCFLFAALEVHIVLTVIAFILGWFAVLLITPLALVVLVESYWRTMYGREGYFTMMLPVRGRTLYAVKVFYASIVVLASAVVALVCTVLGSLALASVLGSSFREDSEALWEVAKAMDPALLAFLLGIVIVQLIFNVVVGATLMSVGAESKFNHLGFGAPVIGAILWSVIFQILSVAATMFIPIGMIITPEGRGMLVTESMFGDFVRAMSFVPAGTEPEIIGLGSVVLCLVFGVLFAWWGARSVEHKTSLR